MATVGQEMGRGRIQSQSRASEQVRSVRDRRKLGIKHKEVLHNGIENRADSRRENIAIHGGRTGKVTAANCNDPQTGLELMAAFIFQGNPDRFEVDAYLENAEKTGSPILWAVSQHEADIQIGDTAYIWRAAGAVTKAISGVVAEGRILSEPHAVPIDKRYWKNEEDASKDKPRVEIDLLKVMSGSKEVIKRDWMKDDPILTSLAILRMAQSTNYLLTQDEHKRLDRLVQNTGLNWTRSESMAALWLYNELYRQPISRTPDSPVAQIALKIDRAVSGVYNKLMNYRAIDPRDHRKGLSGVNQIDREVWKTYFDQDTESIRSRELTDDYARIWSGGMDDNTRTHTGPAYVPAEAPNDDVRRKTSVSVLVRKGQAAFRKRLLHVYDGKCAVSGVDVEAVLDAAHIDDYARSGLNASTNGLLLRSDFHDLFDAGLLKIEPYTLVIRIDQSLSGSYYAQFEGQKIHDRVDGERPSAEMLEAKNRAGS